MKVALITDTHFGCRGDSQIFLDFQERFFKEVFFPYIDEQKITTVVHLVDTFDRRKFINFNTLHRTKLMYFDELAKRKIHSPTIIGNHDTFYKDSNRINSVDLVVKEYHYSNISPIVNECKQIFFGDVSCILVPWICSENRSQVLKFVQETDASMIFGHFAINGFIMHYGHVEDKGLDQDLFKKFDLVASGHFHYKSSQGNIHYLGCPYEMTWGDYGSQKGFHVLDTETLDLEFIENPFKMFHKINYSDGMVFPSVNPYKGTYIKVIVKDRKKSKKFESFLEKLYDCNPFSINVIDQQIDVPDEEIDVSEAEDPPKTLNKYIDSVELPPSIQSDRLKQLLHNTYQKTLEL